MKTQSEPCELRFEFLNVMCFEGVVSPNWLISKWKGLRRSRWFWSTSRWWTRCRWQCNLTTNLLQTTSFRMWTVRNWVKSEVIVKLTSLGTLTFSITLNSMRANCENIHTQSKVASHVEWSRIFLQESRSNLFAPCLPLGGSATVAELSPLAWGGGLYWYLPMFVKSYLVY